MHLSDNIVSLCGFFFFFLSLLLEAAFGLIILDFGTEIGGVGSVSFLLCLMAFFMEVIW